MPKIGRYIGGAGTGKTRHLTEAMEKVIRLGGVEPNELGVCSFTRSARAELARRAAEQFNIPQSDLTDDGWFRTHHSVCYKSLNVGRELLAPGKETDAWITNAVQEKVHVTHDAEDVGYVEPADTPTEATVALNLWSAARNRLEPLRLAHEMASYAQPNTPSLEYCEEIVRRYELHKSLDHRCDFTDLLARFAGWKCYIEGPEKVDPEGYVPALKTWFFDEAQDHSRLIDAVCHRLIGVPQCRYVYVVGDPFQSIYGWAGADPACFRAWPADREKIMPRSYRCPEEILRLGESRLETCSDYFDRKIEPAEHDGRVDSEWLEHGVMRQVEATEDWLILARTNYLAKMLGAMLYKQSIPWVPTRGRGGWNAPRRNEALEALYELEQGHAVHSRSLAKAIALFPSVHEGERMLEHGAKARWAPREKTGRDVVFLESLPQGHRPFCPAGIGSIYTGKWRTFIEHGAEYAQAIEQYGHALAKSPRVRVGTIHSAKGAEADNVLLLATSSAPVERGQDTQSGYDEARRVEYVGCTRARRRLIIARQKNKRHYMRILG